MARRRSGRRPGKQDTRGVILAAARDTFAEYGYDAASIRQIAARAGVDPALVHHYFGTKERLFVTVVQPPVDPATVLPHVLEGGIDGIAERMVRTFLSVWEGPASGPAFRSLLRGAVSHRSRGRLMQEFFSTQIVRRVIPQLATVVDPAEVPLRASLAASQLFGVALARYILEFEPLASVPQETVVAAVAPAVQHYLTGDLSASSTGGLTASPTGDLTASHTGTPVDSPSKPPAAE